MKTTFLATFIVSMFTLAGCKPQSGDASAVKADEGTETTALEASVSQASGRISACTLRYSPGFSPDRVVRGYCIGRYQFVSSTNNPSVLSSLAEHYLGQAAELHFEAENNPVGCNLLSAIAHPIECSTRSARVVVSIMVDGQEVYSQNASAASVASEQTVLPESSAGESAL